MPVFPGSSSPSHRWSFHLAPLGHAVTQWSSVEVWNPSFLPYQSFDFFASETMIATLNSFDSMSMGLTEVAFPLFDARRQDRSEALSFSPYLSGKSSSSKGFLFFFPRIFLLGYPNPRTAEG